MCAAIRPSLARTHQRCTAPVDVLNRPWCYTTIRLDIAMQYHGHVLVMHLSMRAAIQTWRLRHILRTSCAASRASATTKAACNCSFVPSLLLHVSVWCLRSLPVGANTGVPCRCHATAQDGKRFMRIRTLCPVRSGRQSCLYRRSFLLRIVIMPLSAHPELCPILVGVKSGVPMALHMLPIRTAMSEAVAL